MTSLNRRELLQHSATVGLGTVFLPGLGTLLRAEESSQATQPPSGVVLETIKAGGLSHYSYFVGDTEAGVAVVIDPRRDVDVYIELAKQHGMTILYALETHVHADFVSGARELAARTGTAQICASVEGGARYGFQIDRRLKDGDEVSAGSIGLRVIHTPGHTPEHVSFLATSHGTHKPWALFTGDFLFVGSVGRPDLMGVQNTDALARALHHSVQNAFTDLPGELTIYPAHGPGSPCGAGIKAPEGDPTLANERRGNPYWRMNDREIFTEALLNAQPPVPYYWPRMKEINAAGPKVLGGTPYPEMLKPKDFSKRLKSGEMQLLDTRLMQAYAGGHISGALNIGYNEVMSMWGGWVLDPDRPIALVKPAQGNVEGPVDWLSRVGFLNVEVALEGDMSAWVNSGEAFDSFQTMSVHAVNRIFPTSAMTLLDVRQPSEWDMGHLPGAKYMFLPEIPARLQELDKSKPVIVYCGNGYRASIGVSLLRRAGFDARTVPGSWNAWVAAGYPVVKPESPGKPSETHRA
ncbi:MBL fold metallo-hydrolase [Rubinisphaera margarita]|uniref:MBL fold metallo-hydrolase n=1 Tax=Rubinisphaera margarita TaxID=2909586 RepID=UPI001EE84F27|nr:MBL fold metallo-hydrolase [Rubinisphaera margarita]MCG6155875.1 MBL fold metallo-hydrolase [Rubinisphaera margarita]